MKVFRRKPRPKRDQDESPFNVILQEFLDLVPFARGAAVFDFEGETVDYAGDVDPYELRVAAATFQITLAEARELTFCRGLRAISANLSTSTYYVRVLDPNYSLLVVLRAMATHCVSERLLAETHARILLEAGLSIEAPLAWHRVDVLTAARSRPMALRKPGLQTEDGWVKTDVLGVHVGGAQGERSFRIHVANGAEINLVCERSGLWFTDEPLEVALRVSDSVDVLR